MSEETPKMKNFVGVTFSVIMIAATCLFGGYMVHESVLKNELKLHKFDLYIKCVDQNDKDSCKFILR